MKKIKYLFLIISLFLAITAAYMSIYGLTTLLKGNIIIIGCMAILLEISKVLNITYLHEEWIRIKITHKIFMFITTIFLLFVTSSGVFGFLKNSSIQTLGEVKKQEIEVEQINKKIDICDTIISNKSNEQKQLNDIYISYKSNSIDANNAINNIKNNNGESDWIIYSLVKNLNNNSKDKEDNIKLIKKEIDQTQKEIDSINNIKYNYQLQIIEFQSKNINIKKDLGPFYSFAQLIYNKEILTTNQLESTINWYIFIFILIFDPTSISLLLIFLNLNGKYNTTKQEDIIVNNDTTINNSSDDINQEDINNNQKVIITDNTIEQENTNVDNTIEQEVIITDNTIEQENTNVDNTIEQENTNVDNTIEQENINVVNDIKIDNLTNSIKQEDIIVDNDIKMDNLPEISNNLTINNIDSTNSIKKENNKKKHRYSTWYDVNSDGTLIKYSN